jgi:hypothetical protein
VDNQTSKAECQQYPAAPLWAFVDASGDPDLGVQKAGTSPLFVLTAIAVNASSLNQVRAAAECVRGRYFQRGEMKSSTVGGDDERRFRIIGELAVHEFQIFALVVNKARLGKESGLAFKKSFLKYLHEMLFQRLYRARSYTRIVTDEHGSPEFMREFERYVIGRAPSELFQRRDFNFLPSHSDVMLQVADMFAGTLARVYDGVASSALQDSLRGVLYARVARLVTWPAMLRPLSTLGGGGAEHDRTVREYCLRTAMEFVQGTVHSEDVDVRAQHAAVQFLLFRFDFDEHEYVATARLREALVDAGVDIPNDQALRSRVIAKLRDKGIIVASSSRGYKIPGCVSDLMDFVKRTDNVVYPMLHRLQHARDDVASATAHGLDIIGEERFAYMRTLLDAPLPRREEELNEEESLA